VITFLAISPANPKYSTAYTVQRESSGKKYSPTFLRYDVGCVKTKKIRVGHIDSKMISQASFYFFKIRKKGLKMEAAYSSETVVSTNITTLCHNSDDNNLNTIHAK
jgi:hypothetical protein